MNESRLKEMGVPEEVISKVLDEWNKTSAALVHENEAYKSQSKDYEKRIRELDAFKGDNEQLTAKLSQLQTEHKAAQEKFAKDLADYRKSQAIKYALGTMKDAKPHDSGIVLSLLDCSKIDVDDEGNIKGGFDEQINALKKDKSFLFSDVQVRKGLTPPSTVSIDPKAEATKAETSKTLSLGERIAARFAGNASNM